MCWSTECWRDWQGRRYFPKLCVNPLFKFTLLWRDKFMVLFFFPQKIQFREDVLNEFCMMLIQVLYIKVILTLCVNKRNWKILFVDSFPGFVSDLLYEFWQIPKVQEIVSIYLLIKGISRETHGQILNLGIHDFEPVVCWFANRS